MNFAAFIPGACAARKGERQDNTVFTYSSLTEVYWHWQHARPNLCVWGLNNSAGRQDGLSIE